jgi:hypothetical protein
MASRFSRPSSRFRLTAAATAHVAVAAVMCMGLAACGGPGRGVSDLAEDRWPAHAYLVAEGSSPNSREEAELRAREAVAAQIRSSLESNLESRTSSSSDGARESYESEIRQFISQAVSFSHAELIRADPASRRHDDGVYHVLAYLPRMESARVLRRDYDAAAAALQRHADAVDAVPAGDLPAFAAAYGEAREQWLAVERSAMELWAVAGSPPAGFRQDQARWDAVQDRRLQLLSGVPMAFRLLDARPAGDTIDAVRLRQEFLEALTEAGLSIRGDRCDGGGYLIEFQPRLHYQGVIGVICRLDFAGRLVDCASGHAWELHVEDEAFLGEGANTWAARKGAADRVTADALAPLLMDALGSSLPLN